jgi:L-fucose mutarotase
MLIGIPPLLTADLLHALAAMGHGDTIALVDANYPATRGRRTIALPGADVTQVLRAILALLPLDTFVDNPADVMAAVGDTATPPAVTAINAVLGAAGYKPAAVMERFAFYAAAESAYVVVATGERRFYGNVILRKGVIAPEAAQ